MTKEIIKALVNAQLEMAVPGKSKYNSHFKNYYASLDDVYQAIRIPLAKNGLVISHSVESAKDFKEYSLCTTISHESGQSITNSIPMLLKEVSSQGLGAALTYARRQAICSLLALPSEDDLDGEEESQVKKTLPSEKEVDEIHLLGEQNTSVRDNVLKYYKIASLKDLAKIEIDKAGLDRIKEALKKKPEVTK